MITGSTISPAWAAGTRWIHRGSHRASRSGAGWADTSAWIATTASTTRMIHGARLGIEVLDPFEQVVGAEDGGQDVDPTHELTRVGDVVGLGDVDGLVEGEADVGRRHVVSPREV